MYNNLKEREVFSSGSFGKTSANPVIAVLELSSLNDRHAAFNASLLQTIQLSTPAATVELWAGPAHLEAVKSFAPPGSIPCRPIRTWQDEPRALSHSSYYRLWIALKLILSVYLLHRRNLACLVVSSASPAGILAAYLMCRMLGIFVQVPQHGDIASLENGWRSRNPLRRCIDLFSVVRICHGGRFRYVVLEQHIAKRFVALAPWLEGHVDVLPHPVLHTEEASPLPNGQPKPIRIGSLGVATRSKGFDLWARVVSEIRSNANLEFHHIGALHAEFAGVGLPGFATPPGLEVMPRDIYEAQLRDMHYVCIPMQGKYYEMAASGTLLDAICFGKPVIVLRHHITEEMFERYGDIGHICEGEAEFANLIRELAARFDLARYCAQVSNLAALRASRAPSELASTYRQLLELGAR